MANIYIQDNMIIAGDRNLIHIALQNLLGNAWKYSKNKTETEIEFSTIQKDGQVVYFIRDNGAGFDMRYVDKLFGAFQRLHSILNLKVLALAWQLFSESSPASGNNLG